ncbi:MAG: YfhO family protein, partial [Oscillospiraceae bacterium]|nr:YfhO family protein [Oscillospiraceae bacterium]
MLIQKSRARFTFLFALLVASILFVPFIIYGHGYFLYYGDFNVQQIPFYQMAHDAVRSGNLWWSWTTDLGANFIGSYSFYLLGSPFFWLTLPFPSAAVPYLMGPLLILKFACAAVAAYAFLRRFVKPQYASVGGLLYAFSGFSLYNIFFNHFFDAIIIFPLMLLGLEMLMKDNRRGLFGITVFFAALSNYYFFIGQVVFLLLYFLVRALSGEWTLRPVRLLSLALEAVAGTAMAGVLLLPSFFAVIQNYRTGQLVDGWNALYYSTPQRIFDIIHSFIFVQDMPAYANFFPDSANKWASMSAWLPLFGCTGALAYFQSRHHRDWLRRLLIIGVVCAVVPLFNAAFQLFNAMYYARWFYMLTLIMALATVWCFDSADVPWANDAKPTALNAAPVPLSAAHGRTKKSRVPAPASPVNWRRAIGWTLGFIVFFGLIIGLMPSDGFKHFGLAADPLYFLVIVGAALLCLVLTGLLVTLVKRQPSRFFPVGIALVTAVVLLVGWSQLAMGTASSSFTQSYMINNAINGQSVLPAPGQTMTQMERIDTGPYDLDNLGLFWNTPDIQAFHSIV